MKKFLVFALALGLFSLTSCFGNAEKQQASENEAVQQTLDTLVPENSEADSVIELEQAVLQEDSL